MTGLRPAVAALLIWAIHFFVSYGLMLTFPEASGVGWATLGLGLACLAFLGWTMRKTPRQPVAVIATVLAGIAIAWQSIVGVFHA